MRHAQRGWSLVVYSALLACGGGGDNRSQPFALQATGGIYDDGSGRTGVAVLATLRDANGSGPRGEWTGTLSDGSGPRASFAYGDSSVGSVVARWWPDVGFADGDDRLALAGAGGSASADVPLRVAGALGVPQVHVSADGTSLVWDPIAGAAAYACTITDGAGAVRTATTQDPGCGIGDLPDGGWTASVLAYSADVRLVATVPGAQVLSIRTARSSGARQAVRAHFRTGGSPATCGSGTADDHDDLAFAVDP